MKNFELNSYKTFIFDCDGVVLNSNAVKTKAFFEAALPYGKDAAKQLVDHHMSRGGISRYAKFEWFLKNVVAGQSGPTLDQLLATYATEVRHGLLNCEIAEGLHELRRMTLRSRWLIVSGGDQNELCEVFAHRGIASLFDGGIFGSPADKNEILKREIQNGNIEPRAVFIGDSQYDYTAASESSLDFFFLYGWTEFTGWKQYCNNHGITFSEKLCDLLSKDFNFSSDISE